MISSMTDESMGLGVMPIFCGDKLLDYNAAATQQDANTVVQALARDRARALALGEFPYLNVSICSHASNVLLQRATRSPRCITCATCGRCERPSGIPEQTILPHLILFAPVPPTLMSGPQTNYILSRVCEYGCT